MARVMALALRDRARAAMLGAGARGFVRFLPDGPALLVTDACRRCEGGAQALEAAFEAAGFRCQARGELIELTPKDALLTDVAAPQAVEIDWGSPLHPAQALARRWMRTPRRPLTAAGRQLVIDALRLTWLPQERLLAALDALCARAAVMLRSGDRSGMHEAGAILAQWCEQTEGGAAHEAGMDRTRVFSPDGE